MDRRIGAPIIEKKGRQDDVGENRKRLSLIWDPMKKWFLRFALCIAIAMTISGCSVAGINVYFASSGWPQYIMKIGPVACDKKETRVYFANYRNIYGNVGGADLWAADDDRFESGLKKALMSHLARVCSLELYANENGITLTQDEKRKVLQAAEAYYKSLTDAEIGYMGVTERDIQSMYQRYALAEKVYDDLMSTVNEEVSEDEARIMDAYVIEVKKKKIAKKVAEELKNKQEFRVVADKYTEGKKGKISFGRGDYPDEVCDAAFQLEKGEVTKMIETDKGFYFVKCLDKYNQTLSEKNKSKLIEDSKNRLLDHIIAEQRKRYYSNVNLKMLDAVHIKNPKEIKTDSFFTTLNEYFEP